MNMKLSGAQLVLVPIKTIGRNYFPYVEHIANKVVKFIDFAPMALLPGTTASGLTTDSDLYVTIMDENGVKELHKQLPLERLNYTATIGVRQPIFKKIQMDSCCIDCQNPAAVGKVAALVFWYDLPQYSTSYGDKITQPNKVKSADLQTDAIEIAITNITQFNVLPDSDRLAGKRFRRILLGKPSVTPDKNVGLGTAELQNCYLTLRKGTYNVLADCPISLLYQLQMLEKAEFQNIIFDFQSSYVTIGGAGTVTPSDYVGKYIFMNLQYEA